MILLEPFKKTFDFYGRSRRLEFWLFTLIKLLVFSIISLGVTYLVPGTLKEICAISAVFVFIYFWIVDLSISVRRLHDIGKSGFWIFIGLIPLVGTIIILVFYLTPGNSGPNKYGADPKKLS